VRALKNPEGEVWFQIREKREISDWGFWALLCLICFPISADGLENSSDLVLLYVGTRQRVERLEKISNARLYYHGRLLTFFIVFPVLLPFFLLF
jgi:hypothetical protein